MADRAQYLARTLIARIANLHSSFTEDGGAAPDRRQRIAAIEKVLAIELGVTDGTTMALIEATVPTVKNAKQVSDRDVAAFAEFLRQRLGRQLTES
jgi:hypothetical protein